MTQRELDELWSDPANWTALRYRCTRDPRVVVPKRSRLGWTVNFGHPMAVPTLVAMIAIALGPPLAVIVAERPRPNPVHIAAAIALSVVVTMVLSTVLGRARTR